MVLAFELVPPTFPISAIFMDGVQIRWVGEGVSAVYLRHLASPLPRHSMPPPTRIDALIAKHTETATLCCTFLDALQRQEERDYVILLDSSENMELGPHPFSCSSVSASLYPVLCH